MKKNLFFALSLVMGIILLAGCLSLSTTKTVEQPQEETKGGNVQKKDVSEERKLTGVLVDSKTSAKDDKMPTWLEKYLYENGLRSIEKGMPDFADATVFVGEQKGTNLQGIEEWGNIFSANELISTRLETNFAIIAAGAGAGSGGDTRRDAPPANFEKYMSGLRKLASETTFYGARKEADWWGKYRDYKSDGKTVDREEYRFYVLYTMDKTLFDRQLSKLFSDAADATYTNTPEKNQAIEMVNNFWKSLQ
jgi:hypothetical protein